MFRLIRGVSSTEQDPAVFVINRKKHAASILANAYLNKIFQHQLFSKRWAEKESLWLSFEILQVTYSFANEYSGLIGTKIQQNEYETGVCGTHVVHANSEGNIIWFHGGLDERYNHFDVSKRLAHFTHYAFEYPNAPNHYYDGQICVFDKIHSLNEFELNLIQKLGSIYNQEKSDPSLLIILGAPTTDNGRPGSDLQARLDGFVKLVEQGLKKGILILTGGSPKSYESGGVFSEASVMKKILMKKSKICQLLFK